MRVVKDVTELATVTAPVELDAAQPAENSGAILVVDADEGTARSIAAVLRLEGHQVATAFSFAAALAHLRAEPTDLVLADLRVEGQGNDLLARIRELAPDAIVIVLTGVATLATALRALHAGAFNYLVKPVDIAEMRTSVTRGLHQRGLERALEQQVRDLEAAHAQVRSFNAELQQQVVEATQELRDKVQALDGANAQLRHAQQDHDRFVAMVAHEMRGPLNLIINYAQLARRAGMTEEAIDRCTSIVVENSFRLNRLVDDLQTATGLNTGQFSLRLARSDVAAALSELIENFKTTERERRFSLERPATPVDALVDIDRIMQAVRNLVDNAIKYSAKDGAIEVRIWRQALPFDPHGGEAALLAQHAADAPATVVPTDEPLAGRVILQVRDYGAGIPEAEMQRIFDAFTRLNKEPDVAGSGLGLFITRGIIAAHSGTLSVHNGGGPERARGAIFTIDLPAAGPDPAPSATAEGGSSGA